jgi:hypothetical protein
MHRALGFISIVIALSMGMYFYSSEIKSTAPAGATNPEATVNMVGVQNDLLAIARAERQYMAANGSYASLDDLVSGHYLTINGARPPYSYQVDTSAEGFRATASRSGPGSPSQIWIDETMQMHSSD